ncbi:FGGY family carbohydrate kinase, partial [Roseiarcus sp.]|uniref:FGGY family carbohydrate kinase n=1 Tax=Roseiarcus sp. TaxID=1969460 RepID=UPI003C3F7176
MRAGVLVIDQGTTSTRAIVFDADGAPVADARQEIPQIFPQPGWVEHDPESLWSSAVSTARGALRRAGREPATLAAVGIANQRETALLWERASGKPIGNAIVWQDRRTAEACSALKAGGCEPQVTAVTGLLLDPYFSATKIAWALDAAPGARAAAERGELAFGTVDSFLLWRLTNGAVHATDATNASRTMLYDIRKGEWDDDMLRLFNVPAS